MTKLLNVEDGKIISTRTFRNIRRAIKENNDGSFVNLLNELDMIISKYTQNI